MDFRILGPLQVMDDSGPVELGGRKQKALLAVLLLQPGHVVSTNRLVDDLWGEEAPGTAQKMVQIFVSQLRKRLPNGLLRTRAPGYLVELEGHTLDLRRFAGLEAEGREALEQGRPEQASARLRDALAVWRGPALAEFEEPFAHLESSRLEEQRLACLEERVEADLALGRHGELVAELDGLVSRHQHRERMRGQLMLALYRSGRQAEALETYQAFRRTLSDELGIDPSARLKELERRILQQDPSLDAAPRPTEPAAGAAEEPPAPPPLAAAPFGRDRELAELERLFGEELRKAVEAGDWESARASFEAALEQEEAAEALFGLGEALWWLGETDGAVSCNERAYAAFRRRGEFGQAVRAATLLHFLYSVSLGNWSAGRGWMGRAARLVEEFELTPLEGWVQLMRSHDSADPAESERWAREARESARRFGDTNLELCALSQLGAALVQNGQVQEGGALLDEAMAASLGGEGDNPRTVVYTSCNMITSCSQVAEVERATQWIRAADDFSRRYGNPHLYTTCRFYYGSVLVATGDWAEAERQLEAALQSGRTAERGLYGEALAQLAELRLAQGRIEEAERLLEGYENHYTTARASAAVRLARGEPAAAETILRRRLRELEEHDRSRPGAYRVGASVCLDLAGVLDLLIEAELERGAVEDAVATADRLAKLGEKAGCEVIVASAERAGGRALAAAGDPEGAVHRLERALSSFGRLEMPHELARTHLLLAQALPDREAAIEEGRVALAGFELLGAARDADAAAAFLRSLEAKAARRSTGKARRAAR